MRVGTVYPAGGPSVAPIRPSAPISAPRLLTQAQIESEILRLSGLLETATDQLAAASERAAEADVSWKHAEAAAMLASEKGSSELRRADALVKCRKEYGDYRGAEAIRDAIQERCRTLRAQLDSLRTIAANLRSQV